MKIILVGKDDEGKPYLFMKPDSALQKNNKPFFIPDFTQSVTVTMHPVIRVSRLGKNIAERFAHRYYDAITIGLDITAADILEECQRKGLPWEMSNSFDGAAVIGDFIPVSQIEKEAISSLRLDCNKQNVQSSQTNNLFITANKIMAWVSQFYTMKTGDLIYLGACGKTAIHINDRLQGFANEQKLFDFHIR